MRQVLVILMLVLPPGAMAQEGRGWLFEQRLQGSSNSSGLVLRSDSSAGYRFNDHFDVYAGVPVYFVRDSPGETGTVTGLGNVYAGGAFTWSGDSATFISDLVVTAPTGDSSKGFSTGESSIDWGNTLLGSFGPMTPFISGGLANTVSDTSFFVRPFSSSGVVMHYEGGALWGFSSLAGIGGSVYGVRASGEQQVVSRTISGTGRAGSRSFERVVRTVLPADTANDHGFSTWFTLTPQQSVDFQLGYSRSVPYSLNTVFFGMTFRVGPGSR
jgi:hypothetical protein